ncbi:MAG TPA: hypothetical protein VGC13_31980 [Longimicrobium sp.]|jgi:hypothetical protein|uniref:hypothetical protein n=1 Tax=Longimicrobium sp. TaxID=2029185 RepID=UPI002ED90714
MNLALRLALVALAIASSGCTQWRHVPAMPSPREEGVVLIGAARVTPSGAGTMMELRNVQITMDSVIGWREGAADPSGLLRGPRTRVSLHRSQVLIYEPAVPDSWATAGAALLAGLVAYGLYVLNRLSI